MSTDEIFDFKKIVQEPEHDSDTANVRLLKQNFKILNTEIEDEDCEDAVVQGKFTALHLAVWAKSTTIVAALIRQPQTVDINAASDGGLTALHLAVIKNSLKILKILLKQNEIDLNAACLDGWTALHLAIALGHEDLVAEILKFKTKLEINARILAENLTPLQLAARMENEEILKILHACGYADEELLLLENAENALEIGEEIVSRHVWKLLQQLKLTATTPTATEAEAAETYDFTEQKEHDASAAAKMQLFRFVFEGKIDEMKTLLNQGNIDLNAVHKSGKNFWQFAILNGEPVVLECLLQAQQKNAQQPKLLENLLFEAARMGSPTIVKYLIEVKAVNPQLNYGSLLGAAAAGGNLELVRYLNEVHCLAINAKNDRLLCEAVASKNLKMIEYFLEAGLKIEGVYDAKRPILHAAEKANLKIFKYLLEKGADINVKYEGKGVFDYADIGGNLDIMLYLVKEKNFKLDANIGGTNLSVLFQFVRAGSLENIKYLIDVEKLSFKDKKGPLNGTILHEAAWNRNLEVIKYFVQEHALNIMARDDKGCVPLFYAVERNNLAVVEYFLEARNMSMHVKDTKNRTALHIAALNGHLEIVRYLVEQLQQQNQQVNFNIKDNEDTSPLMLAAENHKFETCNYLWEKSKASLNVKELMKYFCQAHHWGNPNLCYANKTESINATNLIVTELKSKLQSTKFAVYAQTIADFLLKDCRNRLEHSEYEFLRFAAVKGNLPGLRFFIEELDLDPNSIKLNKTMTSLHTPIFWACYENQLEIVRHLVECTGVDLSLRDSNKQTVRKYAENHGATEIAAYLASKHAPL